MSQEKTSPQGSGGRAQFCISCFKTLLTCRTLNTNTKNMCEGIFLMPIFYTLLLMKLYHVWWRSIMATLAYGPRLIYCTSFLFLGNNIQLDVKGFKLRIQIKTMNMKWMLTFKLFGKRISLTFQERNPCELGHLPQRQRVPFFVNLP